MLTNAQGTNQPKFGADITNISFADLVGKYEKEVSAILKRYTDCPSTIDEIRQEAFIKAYEKLSLYRGDASFGTWLYTIVRTVALDYLNSQKRRGANRERYVGTVSDTVSPDRMMDSLDAQRVRTAVQRLPKADAMILDLHYFQQRDIAEIASFLGCTPSHVRTKLTRARAKAKAGLEQYFGPEIKDLCPGWYRKDIPMA